MKRQDGVTVRGMLLIVSLKESKPVVALHLSQLLHFKRGAIFFRFLPGWTSGLVLVLVIRERPFIKRKSATDRVQSINLALLSLFLRKSEKKEQKRRI